MTIIAWRDNIIAADCQETHNNLRVYGKKLHKLSSGEVICFVGSIDAGNALLHWYGSGADPAEWPEIQKTDEYATLIVANPGDIVYYLQQPVPIPVYTKYMAWGSGFDYAMGAMAAGATAIKAVELANKDHIFCGLGVDYFYLSV